MRRGSRLLVAGAALTVPLVAVILRRGYGLGAQAMCGGSLHEPLLTVAWPGAHLGPMGLEGAVRLGLRKELEAIADDDEREQAVRAATAAAEENARALNSASLFEIDDVIDPAETPWADRRHAGSGRCSTSDPRRAHDSSTPGDASQLQVHDVQPDQTVVPGPVCLRDGADDPETQILPGDLRPAHWSPPPR